MVSDHTKDVSDFQHEAKNGRNERLKNFASTTTPTLQDHLKMARDMEKQVSQTKG
jgi:putative membrane protein